MPTRQGTAYRVPERRVGRTFAVALLRPPLVRRTCLPCVLVVRYSYRGRYSRAVTSPPDRPAVQSPFASSAFISEGRLP